MHKNILTLLMILLFFISLCGYKKESAERNLENNYTSISAQEEAVQEENVIVSENLLFHFYSGYSINRWRDENGNSKYSFIPYYHNINYSGIGPSWAGLEKGLLKESFINDSLDDLIKLSCDELSEEKIVAINGWSAIVFDAKGKKKESFTPDEIEYIRNRYQLLSPETRVYEFRYIGK